jgi:Natural resistance-associated macrophage protein
VGLLLALVGILFAVGGAAIETSFAGAYNLAQFFGWRWGKKERPARAPRFSLSWLLIFALALMVVMTGYDPVKLTEYSVIFSVVALPLTYLPILLVANDRAYMGADVNGKLANFLGGLYFVIILAIAVAAIPLMLLTHGGRAGGAAVLRGRTELPGAGGADRDSAAASVGRGAAEGRRNRRPVLGVSSRPCDRRFAVRADVETVGVEGS